MEPSRSVITFDAKWVHVLLVGLTIGTFFITYPVSLFACHNGDECMTETEHFFLSDSINYSYGQSVGVSLLMPGVFLLLIANTIKYFEQNESIAAAFLPTSEPLTSIGPQESSEEDLLQSRLRKLTRRAWIITWPTVAGGIGVCAWPIRVVETVHNISALVFFAGTSAFLLLYTYVDYKLAQRCAGLRNDRLLLIRIASLAAVAVILVAFAVFFSVWDKEGLDWKVSTATCEVAIYLCYEVCYVTWYPVFWGRTFSVASEPKPVPVHDEVIPYEEYRGA